MNLKPFSHFGPKPLIFHLKLLILQITPNHPPTPSPPPFPLCNTQTPNPFLPRTDIKPSNILLCRNGAVKLCDFGVSGEFGTRGDANTFIGTSYYMAPERITGQSYTITSDVWSLGVTLLEVAQHQFPFPVGGGAGLIDLLTFIVGQPIPKLRDEPPGADGGEGIRWSESFKYFIQCW